MSPITAAAQAGASGSVPGPSSDALGRGTTSSPRAGVDAGSQTGANEVSSGEIAGKSAERVSESKETAQSGDAEDILARMRKALTPGEDMRADVEFVMRSDDSANDPIRWRAVFYRRHGESPVQRILFKSPQDLKGVELFAKDRPKGLDVIKMYLPALRRVRTIRRDMLGAPFLGTDFNYENLGLEELDFQDHRIVGRGEVDGRPCTKIESVPEESRLWYGKILRCIDREDHLPRRTEYFDEPGLLYKLRTIDRVERIESYPTPMEITMKSEAERTSTTLIFSNVDYNVKLEDRDVHGERGFLLEPPDSESKAKSRDSSEESE